jgi:glycosyltransferase involved in cell wall biosynthesis
MRVLVVPRDFPSDAEPQSGIYVLRQVQALQALGHHIRVVRVVPKAPPMSRKWRAYRSVPRSYSIEGVDVHTLRAIVPPRMFGIGIVRAQVASELRREAEEFGADLVHVHCVIPTGALTCGTSVPTVLTAHGSDTYREPWRRSDLQAHARAAVASATAVTAVSGFVKEAVAALGRPDADVIYNGADERFFEPMNRAAARASLGINNGRPVVVYAGNLIAAKGLYDLIDALAALDEPRPLALLAGDGPEARGLRARFDSLHLENRLLGRLSQPEIATALGAADVFVFPSHAEGLPGAICEAMLAGRAVVASRVGGIPEIIEDGENGLLVPHANPPALSRALQRLLGDSTMRVRFEQNAREFALRRLTWRTNAIAYEALYRRVLAPRDQLHRSA